MANYVCMEDILIPQSKWDVPRQHVACIIHGEGRLPDGEKQNICGSVLMYKQLPQ